MSHFAVTEVVPKQVVVKLEITLEALVLLKSAFDAAEFKLNLSSEYDKKVNDFVMQEFYPTIAGTLKELNHGADA